MGTAPWRKILTMAEGEGINRTFLRHFFLYSSGRGPFCRYSKAPLSITHPFTETNLDTFYYRGFPELSGAFFQALCERAADADEFIIWAEGEDLTWLEVVTIDERILYGPLSETVDPFVCYMGRGLIKFVSQFGEAPLSRRYINYDSDRRLIRWSRNRPRKLNPYFTLPDPAEGHEAVAGD